MPQTQHAPTRHSQTALRRPAMTSDAGASYACDGASGSSSSDRRRHFYYASAAAGEELTAEDGDGAAASVSGHAARVASLGGPSTKACDVCHCAKATSNNNPDNNLDSTNNGGGAGAVVAGRGRRRRGSSAAAFILSDTAFLVYVQLPGPSGADMDLAVDNDATVGHLLEALHSRYGVPADQCGALAADGRILNCADSLQPGHRLRLVPHCFSLPVDSWKGGSFMVEARLDDTLAVVLKRIAQASQLPLTDLFLFCASSGSYLGDLHASVRDLGLLPGSSLRLAAPSFRMLVASAAGPSVVQVHLAESADDLRARVAAATGLGLEGYGLVMHVKGFTPPQGVSLQAAARLCELSVRPDGVLTVEKNASLQVMVKFPRHAAMPLKVRRFDTVAAFRAKLKDKFCACPCLDTAVLSYAKVALRADRCLRDYNLQPSHVVHVECPHCASPSSSGTSSPV